MIQFSKMWLLVSYLSFLILTAMFYLNLLIEPAVLPEFLDDDVAVTVVQCLLLDEQLVHILLESPDDVVGEVHRVH